MGCDFTRRTAHAFWRNTVIFELMTLKHVVERFTSVVAVLSQLNIMIAFKEQNTFLKLKIIFDGCLAFSRCN